MTLSYNIGLTAGSLMSYILDDMLGPPVPNGCTVMPAIIKASVGSSKINITSISNQFASAIPTNATMTAIANSTGSSTTAMIVATMMTAATAATSTFTTMTAQAAVGAVTSSAPQILKTMQPSFNVTSH